MGISESRRAGVKQRLLHIILINEQISEMAKHSKLMFMVSENPCFTKMTQFIQLLIVPNTVTAWQMIPKLMYIINRNWPSVMIEFGCCSILSLTLIMVRITSDRRSSVEF